MSAPVIRPPLTSARRVMCLFMIDPLGCLAGGCSFNRRPLAHDPPCRFYRLCVVVHKATKGPKSHAFSSAAQHRQKIRDPWPRWDYDRRRSNRQMMALEITRLLLATLVCAVAQIDTQNPRILCISVITDQPGASCRPQPRIKRNLRVPSVRRRWRISLRNCFWPQHLPKL
jgi:hypothetical protein